MACNPPRTTSARYAALNSVTPAIARITTSRLLLPTNSGSITCAMMVVTLSGQSAWARPIQAAASSGAPRSR